MDNKQREDSRLRAAKILSKISVENKLGMWEPTKMQRLFVDKASYATQDFSLYAVRRKGKSTAAVVAAVCLAASKLNIEVGLVLPNYNSFSDILRYLERATENLPTVREIYNGVGGRGAEFETGSRISLLSAYSTNALLYRHNDYLIFDEAQLTDPDIFNYRLKAEVIIKTRTPVEPHDSLITNAEIYDGFYFRPNIRGLM